MSLQPGDVVLIQSDYTKGTRGESQGQLEGLLRILMRREVKFWVYSLVDPQAPQVAKDVIDRVNEERRESGKRPYRKWEDYVELGYLANPEATANVMATNLRQAFASVRDVDPQNRLRSIWESPVLQNVKTIGDLKMVVNIHASAIINTLIERLSGKVPLASMCTGVMVPEVSLYYTSGQLFGLVGGLKGVYDLETLMEFGVNSPGPDGKVLVTSQKTTEVITGFAGEQNLGRGNAYYPTLHVALTLLILAVVIGNVGVFLTKLEARR
jgi:hypothetical protein